VGIAALAAGCGGAVEDGLTSGNETGDAGSGNTGEAGSGNTGEAGSDNGGEAGSGNSGEAGSGNSGVAGSSNGEAGSGNTGEAGSGNSGEAGSGNGQAGSGNTGNCDVSMCDDADVGGFITLPGCCPDNGGGCGLDVSAAEQFIGVSGCIELDQEGRQDDQCPAEVRPAQPPVPETEFPGCCRPNNSCGYWVDMSQYGVPSFGCIDPAAIGGPSVGLPCNY